MDPIDRAGWTGPRRILGMKVWQAALLGVLGALDCLVVVAGLAIVLGAGMPALPAAPPPLGRLAETDTPTAAPTAAMEGWVKYTVPAVEIWMPGTYAAGDPHKDAAAIVAALKQMGANFNWSVIEQQLKTSSENYVLWGIDSHQGNPAVVTNVAVAYDFPNPGEPLADYATHFVGAISDSFVLIESKNIRHPEYEVQRILLDTKDTQGTPMRIAMYAMRDGNIIWDMICFTAVDEMDARLPSFDQMAVSFRALATA
jgi:hypothetical protein